MELQVALKFGDYLLLFQAYKNENENENEGIFIKPNLSYINNALKKRKERKRNTSTFWLSTKLDSFQLQIFPV